MAVSRELRIIAFRSLRSKEVGEELPGELASSNKTHKCNGHLTLHLCLLGKEPPDEGERGE